MEYTCIVCPNGCSLFVEKSADGVIVTGNRCPKGAAYGRDEISDPRRVVTAVVRTTDPDHPCVPVKTDRPIQKERIPAVLRAIYQTKADLPVCRGDICIANCCGTGASIIFTRSFPRQLSKGTP